MTDISRRRFLLLAGLGLATPFVITSRSAQAMGSMPPRRAPLPNNEATTATTRYVFPHSVASGDPTPSGAVIWTRLNPETVTPGQDLDFELATDPDGAELVLTGRIPSTAIAAERDFTVTVDLDGELGADRVYYYRFRYGGTPSRLGRLRTTLAGGQRSMKLAVVTCQDFTNGYYGAYSYIARDLDIDYVIHLGDFIYETTGNSGFQDAPYPERRIQLPSGANVALGLDDYHALYRAYRSDRFLQQAMENHTWIVATDDHETANDVYWDYARDTLGAPDHPFTDDAQYGNDPALLRRLKIDSQAAWLNYIPARVQVDRGADHPWAFSRIYRNVRFGDLAEIFMTDTRTYRTPHPCGEGEFGERYVPTGCDAYNGPEHSILGDAQREWLFNGLAASGAQWKLLGNQTYLGRLAVTLLGKPLALVSTDAWDGYAAERRQLTGFVSDQGIDNFVVLTGDMHSYLASYVKTDYGKLTNIDFTQICGVEFMTPSVTSANFTELLSETLQKDVGEQAVADALSEGVVRANNPHIRYFNSARNGYSTLDITANHVEWTAYAVDKSLDSEEATRTEMIRLRKDTLIPWLNEI